MGSTKRTTIRLTDERHHLLDQAKDTIAAGETDDPPNSVVIDAVLTHLIEYYENLDDGRQGLAPTTVQWFDSRWSISEIES